MFPTRHIRRAALVATVALMAIALVLPGAALADTLLGQSGEIGSNSLRDSMSKPGVTCHYSSVTDKLKSFTVRPPRLSSDDAFPADVGWRIRVQRKGPNSTSWSTIFNSSIQHGTASEGTYASFTKRTVSPSFPTDPKPFFTDYRVVVVMYQFYGDGSVAGRARRLVDWYFNGQLFEVFGPGGACSRKTGIF